jgi:hypothetical protein
MSAQTSYRDIRTLASLAQFLAAAGITTAGGISRNVLERYLADLAAAKVGRREHRDHIGQVATFLRVSAGTNGTLRCPRPRSSSPSTTPLGTAAPSGARQPDHDPGRELG